MGQGAFLVDSNILIRWVQPSDPQYQLIDSAFQFLVNSQVELYYTSQNLGEFWNALTRPVARNGYGLSVKDVNIRAKQVESQLRLLPDSVLVHEEWRRMLVDYDISGVQVHDARLAAAMRVHGVRRILTFNTRDFRRFSEVEAVAPQDVIAKT